jgi:HEAT repeat protein
MQRRAARTDDFVRQGAGPRDEGMKPHATRRSIMSISRSYLAVAALAAAAPAVHANVAFKDAPKQTPAQAKAFNWVNQAGGLYCEPKGKLAALVGDPYKCYIKLEECGAAVATLSGKLDPSFLELFADMAAIDPKSPKAKFVNTCPGDNGPQFVELLAIRGLGYSRDVKYAPLLAAIVAGQRAEQIGPGLRIAVTEAFAYMGDQTAAVAPYRNLLTVHSLDPEYKDTILQMLGNWHNDAGVEFCTSALTSDEEKRSLDACTFYLGRRNAAATVPTLVRSLEKHEIVSLHALGQMNGNKDALDAIHTFLDSKATAPYRTRLPAVVAAINLGDKQMLAELESYLAGKKPPNPKSKAKPPKTPPPIDQEMIGVAAMESLLLTDKTAIAAANKAITAAAANPDAKDWKGYVYATIALAQRGGDATALAKLLGNPKEDIRNAVVDAIGGRAMHPGEYWPNTGFGFVADAGVATALEQYVAAETNKEARVRAVNALGMTRSMLMSAK